MTQFLFAYGFLKRAYHGSKETNTPHMEVEFVEEGKYSGRIYKVDRYPGVVYDAHDDFSVHGEVFKIKDPTMLLPILDEYEHSMPLVTVEPHYNRVLRNIKTENGLLECWVYEYLKPINEEKRINSNVF